jgi:hypothetical protein
VVDPLPPGFALNEEITDPTVIARDRLGLRLVGDEALESPAHVTGVRVEVLRSKGLPLARAKQDVDVIGLSALETPEQLVVEAELEDVRGLGASRELGVESLVRSLVRPNEEVRDPAPVTLREDTLIHDVDALFDRFASILSSALVPIVGGDLADVEAFVAQAPKVRRLMREALFEQKLGLLRGLGRHEIPVRDPEVERCQMLAR